MQTIHGCKKKVQILLPPIPPPKKMKRRKEKENLYFQGNGYN